jgi:hypothetical protein
MLRYILFGLGLAVAIVAFQLYLNQLERDQDAPSMNHADVKLTQSSVSAAAPVNLNQPSAPHADSAAPETVTNSNSVAMTSRSASSAEASDSAWQADPDAPAPPTRFSHKGINPTPLKIQKQTIARAAVGDTLSLPIPQTNQDYEMSIQQVGEHQNGDKTLKGHLTNQPEYTVVVTQGSSATYATINTPDGSFLLEADQEQGWLMAATDLDTLIDPNLADYRIPGINRNTVN